MIMWSRFGPRHARSCLISRWVTDMKRVWYPVITSTHTVCLHSASRKSGEALSDQLTRHTFKHAHVYVGVQIFTIFIAARLHTSMLHATSKSKRLWAPTVLPAWGKSEDISANKASDSQLGLLLTSILFPSLLAKPQIQPGELQVAQ